MFVIVIMSILSICQFSSFRLWKWFHLSSGAVRPGIVAALVVAEISGINESVCIGHSPITESNPIILIIRSDGFMQTAEIQKPWWVTWVKGTAHHQLFLCKHLPQGFAAAPWSIQFLYHLYQDFQCQMRTLINVNIFLQAEMALK